MTGLQIYRRWLCAILAIALFFSGFYFYYAIKQRLPDTMMLQAGDKFNNSMRLCTVSIEEKTVETAGGSVTNIPKDAVEIVGADSNFTFQNTGSYTAEYKLFGLIDLKSVDVNVIEEQSLYAGGCPAGIYVETKGVMIIGAGSVGGMDGNEYRPAENIVKSGDYIYSVNGESVSNKEQFVQKINQYGSDDVILGIRRNQENIKVKIKPIQTGLKEYKLGIWIRDNTQGVGMITFMKENGEFGALGHGITDIDTGLLMEIEDGKLFHTEIVSILKGEKGTPGELIGMIDYNTGNQIGKIESNTRAGIFGTLQTMPEQMQQQDTLKIAMKEEIKKGPAYIQTCLNGVIEHYEIEIQEININDTGNKGMVIQVKDDMLLKKTGGIVQGMSGSPIIQDGRIIGAVTHVFVNDPTKGYGIFIETMLQQ